MFRFVLFIGSEPRLVDSRSLFLLGLVIASEPKTRCFLLDFPFGQRSLPRGIPEGEGLLLDQGFLFLLHLLFDFSFFFHLALELLLLFLFPGLLLFVVLFFLVPGGGGEELAGALGGRRFIGIAGHQLPLLLLGCLLLFNLLVFFFGYVQGDELVLVGGQHVLLLDLFTFQVHLDPFRKGEHFLFLLLLFVFLGLLALFLFQFIAHLLFEIDIPKDLSSAFLLPVYLLDLFGFFLLFGHHRLGQALDVVQ